MLPTRRPLIVRLRNWVGDVVLGIPTLERLAGAGYSLQLVGRGWARDLLAGYGWPVQPLPPKMGQRIQQLRALRHAAVRDDPGFARRINSLCLPDSFGSALEFRLAGLRALGHAYEGRSLLLGRAMPRSEHQHMLRVYWQLGDALLGSAAEPPPDIGMRLAGEHRMQAQALRQQHGLADGYVVICPFAGGTWNKQPKTWPAFSTFAATELPRFKRQVVICPGPGEEEMARTQFPGATLLPAVGLGAYAALLQGAALMISNDTGPGHLAAAVGAPLLSVLGPTEPEQWGAWGHSVRVVRQWPGWPDMRSVADAVGQMLTRQ